MIEPDDQPLELDAVTQEAIAWIVRLISGEATTDDAANIRRWRAQSDQHEDAFRSATRLWKAMKVVARAQSRQQLEPGDYEDGGGQES